jgi:hypothetical protein
VSGDEMVMRVWQVNEHGSPEGSMICPDEEGCPYVSTEDLFRLSARAAVR